MSCNGNNCDDDCLCRVINCFVGAMQPKGGCCGHWLQASGSSTQVLDGAPNAPHEAHIDTVDGASGTIALNGNGAVVSQDGDYMIVAAPQVGRANAGPPANFRCWLAVNGNNVPNSNVLKNMGPNDAIKDVIVTQGIISLSAGDKVTVVCATNEPASGVALEAIQTGPNEPLVPSIIFTVHAV